MKSAVASLLVILGAATGAASPDRRPRVAPVSTRNAPSARAGHTAVWTGSEMIVWGGDDSLETRRSPLSTGGRYDLTDGAAHDPKTGQWRTLSSQGGVRRGSLVGVWTGKAFLTVGEASYDEKFPDQQGGLLKPQGGWLSFHVGFGWQQTTVVWTGRAAVVWGGFNGTNVENRGFRIVP